MNYWNNLEFLQKASTAISYISICLGFIVALCGQWFADKIDKRIDSLKIENEIKRKTTTPLLDAILAVGTDNKTIYLEIEFTNYIPVYVDHKIVTENNIQIDGIQLQEMKLVPTEKNKVFHAKIDFDSTKITNSYIELRLNYSSVYFEEYPEMINLKGKIVKKYKMIRGLPHPLKS